MEAIKYKEVWEEKIKHCREHGLQDPEPVPHPDSVIIDRDTGLVAIVGPILSQEKRDLNELDELCSDLSAQVEKLEAKRKAKPRDREIAHGLKGAQQILETLMERRAFLRQRR